MSPAPLNPAHLHPETLAILARRGHDPATGAVVAPLHLATTFERDRTGTPAHDFLYTRHNNPNRQAWEQAIATLEGGAVAAAFASGTAASLAVLQAVGAGGQVVAPLDVYQGTRELLAEWGAAWGIGVTWVDATDTAQVLDAVTPETRLVWLETPSNPMLRITDVGAIAAGVRRSAAPEVMILADNTWATPMLQRPLALGCDWVLHSTTKYFGGHSDVLGGAVVARSPSPAFEAVRRFQTLGGGVPSPFDCWLLLRSVATLPVRMRSHCAGARQVADFLASHPQVARVHYPGLPGHPGGAIAAAQMTDFGGMVSAEIRGGAAAALAVADRVQLFTHATSLGGVESIIDHRKSLEGERSATPDSLLRLSIGLEHPDDLIADLAQALAGISDEQHP